MSERINAQWERTNVSAYANLYIRVNGNSPSFVQCSEYAHMPSGEREAVIQQLESDAAQVPKP